MPGQRLLSSGAILLALTASGWSQRASNWRVYRLADHLPESASVAVTFSAQGKVFARHLSLPLVTELDGYSVKSMPSPETGRSRVYPSPGGQLWTAVGQGLQEFRDGSWVLHPVAEIAAESKGVQARVIDPIPLSPVRQGLVIFLLPGGLMEFNNENPDRARVRALISAKQLDVGKFLDLAPARDGGLWISGEHGLAKSVGIVRHPWPRTEWKQFLLPEQVPLRNIQAPHEDSQGGVVAVAQSSVTEERSIVLFDGQTWVTKSPGIRRVRQAWAGWETTGWAIAIDSLLRWDRNRPEVVEDEEVSARQYFDVALERSGAFWLATSDGLFRYAPLTWRRPTALSSMVTPVNCLAGESDGRLWFASGRSLFAFQNDRLSEYPVPALESRGLQAHALFVLKNGALVLEAEGAEPGTGSHLCVFQPARAIFTPVAESDAVHRTKVLGMFKDGTLCVQEVRLDPGDATRNLQKFDGQRFQPIAEPPPPFLGTNLSTLFAAQNGDLWLSGELGTALLHDNKWVPFWSADKSNPDGVQFFIELSDGKVWCADQDEVWEFYNRNWSVVRRGFDRINAMVRARDGTVWVASNSGLHRFISGVPGGWVENSVEEGLPSAAVREVYEDQTGGLWAATTRGLARFYPEADPDPPQTQIEALNEAGNSSPDGRPVYLTFHAQDRWKFTASERLLYTYRLDERDWSTFQDANHVPFTDLAPGKHYFQVRAVDRNCNVESKAAQMEFVIVVPWYKETRLVVISGAGFTAALFFAGLAFNRHRKLLKSYTAVELQVAERTRQLENTSRELVHSQKMNALGSLAAGIAHDFNNILSIIKGSAQIIEDNLDNPQKIQTRTDRIKTVVEQGAGIVKAMLGFSRESGQPPTACDLNAVVEETLRLLGDRFLRELEVRFVPSAGLPMTLITKDFVQQILLNFIFNAAESMTRDRQIVLETRVITTLPSGMALVPAPAQRYVSVSVKDFGCGIPEENLPRIFEPFFTTKALSSRRGTGLGLSMVYELAKRLGAGLLVNSVVDQGSTFHLILPVIAGEPVASEPSP